MKITPILGNFQRHDVLATRALLLQTEGRNILFETGVGNFFDPKRKERS